MRGEDKQQHDLFSCGSLEDRVPEDHPLRPIRTMVDEALKSLSVKFDELYGREVRPSIAPERLLRALLLQMLYTVRSERVLMEQLDYSRLFRCFVGLSMSDAVWHPTVFTKNRDRLLEGEIAREFFEQLLRQARRQHLVSSEHFTVDGTMIEAWAGQKSFQPKNNDDLLKFPSPPAPGSNPTANYHGQKRSNETHESKTDPMARLCRKSHSAEAKLVCLGHVMTENRNGLIVNTVLTQATDFDVTQMIGRLLMLRLLGQPLRIGFLVRVHVDPLVRIEALSIASRHGRLPAPRRARRLPGGATPKELSPWCRTGVRGPAQCGPWS
jgi:transposase